MKRKLGLAVLCMGMISIGSLAYAEAPEESVTQQEFLIPEEETVLDVADMKKPYYVKVKESLTLRDRASSSAQALAVLGPDDIVEILSYKGKYAKVMTQAGQEGYVMQQYLRPASDPDMMEKLKVVDISSADYSHQQLLKELKALQKKYPELISVKSVGKSVDGRQIPVYVFGDPNAKYAVFIQAAIHAREGMTSMLVMKQLEYYAANYEKGNYDGRALKDIFQDVSFHVFAMTNPDGVEISRQNSIYALKNEKLQQQLESIRLSDTETGRYTKKEKYYYSSWKANANGVDINKNFSESWGVNCKTLEPSTANYIGPEAMSEPETQAIEKYMNKYHFDAAISYHSYGSIIYFESIAEKDMRDQATDLAELMGEVTGYTLVRDTRPEEDKLYDESEVIGGGFKEWAMISQKVPTVTLETGLQGCPLSISEFLLMWDRNRDVWPEVALWVKS